MFFLLRHVQRCHVCGVRFTTAVLSDSVLVLRDGLPAAGLAHELTTLYEQRLVWKLLQAVVSAHGLAAVVGCPTIPLWTALPSCLLHSCPLPLLLLLLLLLSTLVLFEPPLALSPLLFVVPDESGLFDVSHPFWRGWVGKRQLQRLAAASRPSFPSPSAAVEYAVSCLTTLRVMLVLGCRLSVPEEEAPLPDTDAGGTVPSTSSTSSSESRLELDSHSYATRPEAALAIVEDRRSKIVDRESRSAFCLHGLASSLVVPCRCGLWSVVRWSVCVYFLYSEYTKIPKNKSKISAECIIRARISP